MPTTIEELWHTLCKTGSTAQRRVDESHPLDIYADFEFPGRPGLIVITRSQPRSIPVFRAIRITQGLRSDGRWTMRISLLDPQLMSVFIELCRDIVESTLNEVDEYNAASVVLSRIERWGTLLKAETNRLDRSALRGLLGELLFLETKIFPRVLDFQSAIDSWTGPFRLAQDFTLASGLRVEVKSVVGDADTALINGLGQLDSGDFPLQLAVVRLEDTQLGTLDSITVLGLIERIRSQLSQSPVALVSFNGLLGLVGWDDHKHVDDFAVRLIRIDRFDVGLDFPRLTARTVPTGILSAIYKIALPRNGSFDD